MDGDSITLGDLTPPGERQKLRNATSEIRSRIRETGPITFAEFHEIALSWPVGGYYSDRSPIGPNGDFYTAPTTHPVFGALIGRQLAELWRSMGSPKYFWVIEPGSGTGVLAHDILDSLESSDPAFLSAVRYTTIDLRNTANHLPRQTDHIQSSKMPFKNVEGCIIANELLDALPFHRVAQINGRLKEIMVGIDQQGQFVETIEELSTPLLQERLRDLNINLPDGYRTEINLLLKPWLENIANILTRGYALLIDYGHEASTLYDESRSTGTLRCYFRHTLNANPYQRVSQQDISCHVDFTSVMNISRSVGLVALGYKSQQCFLRNLGWGDYHDAIINNRTLSIAQRRANTIAMQTLVSLDGMGKFKVLLLGKGIKETVFSGFSNDASGDHQHNINPVPLLKRRHISPIPLSSESVDLPSWKDLLT